MNTTVLLAVAGLKVEIVCPSERWAEAVAARYAPWLAEGQRHGRVLVQRAANRAVPQTANAAPELGFEPGRVTLQGAGWAGEVSSAGREAWVRTLPATLGVGLEHVLRVATAQLAFAAGGLLLHAAGLALDGRAYLFCGPSGTGKSTVARLSTDAEVLNDDLVVLQPALHGWVVHSTPFTGPDQVAPAAGPRSAPLAALLRLEQAAHVYLEPLSAGQALVEILAAVPVPTPDKLAALMARALALSRAVPVGRLHFRREASFWNAVPGYRGTVPAPHLAEIG